MEKEFVTSSESIDTPSGGGNNSASFFKKNRWGIVLILFVLITSFLLYQIYKPNRAPDIILESDSISEVKEGSNFVFKLTPNAFASTYEEVSKIVPKVPYSKVLVPELSNLASFEDLDNFNLSEPQKIALESDGFFLQENNIIADQSSYDASDDFVDAYKMFSPNNIYRREANEALFISSDSALHLYHILIDRTFEKIEEDKFQAQLREMSEALFLDAIEGYRATDNLELKEAYKVLASYYLVPLVILDSAKSATLDKALEYSDYENFALYQEALEKEERISSEKELDFKLAEKSYLGVDLGDEIYEIVKSELSLIKEASKIEASPLLTPYRREFLNDYSQFVPRSHYTKNDTLKTYFIAMMWYGRLGFSLNSDILTKSALITTGQINSLEMKDGQKVATVWSDMMATIDFFVGEVDDLSAFDYTPLIKKVYGEDVFVSDFANEKKLAEFRAKAKTEFASPKIISEALELFDDGGKREELLEETKQFRFMGQRFTPDAYIINNLSQGEGQPDPETGQLLPSMPTALMTLNVIAPENETVASYLNEWINDRERIEKEERESDRIIAKVANKLKAEFKTYTILNWQSNIYMRWLDSFRSLLSSYGAGYPAFMQSEAWAKKNLGTVLGSYTELKHDTLLYAKQSYAELGAGYNEEEEIPAVPMGYVEPDLVFWNKIIALAKTTVEGLEARNIMPQDFKSRYKAFIDSAEFFQEIATLELLNEKISEDQFEELRTIFHNNLDSIVAPLPGKELSDKEKRSGIIADIHTDAIRSQVLYEATGKPHIIYVAVKDANGSRLTRGLVFNHYEFSEKLDGRLNDEAWQERVYLGQGEMPQASPWTKALIK